MFRFSAQRWLLLLLLAVLFVLVSAQPQAQPRSDDTVWISVTESEQVRVHLYFFWSKKCPHCLEARPFIENMAHERAWLVLHSLELTEYPGHVKKYALMAEMLGQEARSVPAFLWCGKMVTGFDNAEGMGAYLESSLRDCRDHFATGTSELPAASIGDSIAVPLLGRFDEKRYSLPLYTVMLAAMDAFNPCAFFVLLFLLSLLVNAKSRSKIIMVGGIFVFFSGALYFLFMTAWLNLFLLMGRVETITVIAGVVAVSIALINIKDFFWFRRGVTLSIPDSAKPGLFQRMRNTVKAGRLTAMIIATIALAGFANMYEFLCTAGFPMVYTRILTINELDTASYYLYLLLYNVIYVVPLAVIVVLFAATLGSRKLSEQQGRMLKLVSGVMMLLLGLVLIVHSQWLNHVGIALLILLASLLISWLIVLLERRVGKPASGGRDKRYR